MDHWLPPLRDVERLISERMRELRLLKSLLRILRRKQQQDHAAAENNGGAK